MHISSTKCSGSVTYEVFIHELGLKVYAGNYNFCSANSKQYMGVILFEGFYNYHIVEVGAWFCVGL